MNLHYHGPASSSYKRQVRAILAALKATVFFFWGGGERRGGRQGHGHKLFSQTNVPEESGSHHTIKALLQRSLESGPFLIPEALNRGDCL